MKKVAFGALILLIAACGLAACVASRAGYETAPYKVIRADGDFDIREYPSLKIAKTESGNDNDSFMRLFRYIDGGNVKQEKIAMTTPVLMVDGYMAFVVPEKYKADTPAPVSPQVDVTVVKAQRVAAYRFRGSRNKDDESAALETLRGWMKVGGLREGGKPFTAYYDPPWIPGFARRNEVLIPLGNHGTRAPL